MNNDGICETESNHLRFIVTVPHILLITTTTAIKQFKIYVVYVPCLKTPLRITIIEVIRIYSFSII